jgi:hypothetical protein
MLSFSDPMWRGLRSVSLISGAATIILLAVVLSGAPSWRFALMVSVLTNIAVVVAVLIRTLELRAKLRHQSK